MKRSLLVLIPFILITSTAFGESISCDLYKRVSINENTRKFRIGREKEKVITVKLFHIREEKPYLKENREISNLMRVGEREGNLWFLEIPPEGGLNLYTYFIAEKSLLLSRQYRLVGIPFGMLLYGKCKDI